MKKSTIVETIKNSKLPQHFSVNDVNKYCDNLLIKSPSFLSKHCENNPGNYNVYFKRINTGSYSLL